MAETQTSGSSGFRAAILRLMERLLPVWDNLFLTEPGRWIVSWAVLAAGYGVGKSVFEAELFWRWSPAREPFLLFAGVTLLLAAAALLRQVARLGQDDPPGPANRLAHLERSGGHLDKVAWLLAAAGLLAILPSGPWGVLFAFGLFLTSGGAEGVAGLRGNRWRLPRLLEYLASGILMLLLGYAASGSPLDGAWNGLRPYFMAYLAVGFMLLMAPFDAAGDAPAIVPKSPPGWGAMLLSTALILAAVYAGYRADDPVITTAGSLILPFYAVNLLYRRPSDIARTIRYSVLMLILFVGARYPLIYPATLLNFYLCRFYFKRRYGVGYPLFTREPS